jgi:50S ribosomal subunit-associated GTPase HflX
VEDIAELHLNENGANDQAMFVSAKTKYHLTEMRELLAKEVKKEHIKIYPNYLEPETY